MKRIKRAVKQQNEKQECDHAEAFSVSVFHDCATNTAYLIQDCPDCGAAIEIVGTCLKHLGE